MFECLDALILHPRSLSIENFYQELELIMFFFLGYPSGIKCYKLYDVNNKETFVSRDVVFYESIFSFFTMSSSETLIANFTMIGN